MPDAESTHERRDVPRRAATAELERERPAEENVSDARFRTWTSRSGKATLEAELIEFRDGMVLLATPDGTRRSVRVHDLSQPDRDLVAAWQSALEFEPVGFRAAESTPADPAGAGNADMSLRNPDYPNTFIESIHVDLASPRHWVRLTWTGPDADRQEAGPFRSSPGRGLGRNNCDNFSESNRDGSNCTPKGEHVVDGFSDYLPSVPRCKFVTWFQMPRQIAFHSHWIVPSSPASHGCVRLDVHAAQLIHNNAVMGQTKVTVEGTWTR